MRMLYVIAYLAIEIGAFVAMTHFLGLGWAVLITLGAVVAGFALLQQQGRKVFAELRRASRNEVDPRGPLTDTALLAAATLLMVLPGVVSTTVGLILLVPPVRRALRPVVAAAGAKSFAASMDRAGLYASGIYVRGGTVVDGTVVESDGTTWTPPSSNAGDRRLPRGH
ncbi:FxsA family protein [Gordonia sp. HNM0687]|uniref:FxsA family protein n=1 Tax=Gordonia mangrovi TaxID=2665643 RepID=A0A6L7GQD9_9ACTN|nr:FxsA family protein [Gordonia mangrovi]MXP22120.1 FxsA family protein [Gordonia mangrovi]UVF80900.1 FxsA family protein [Gordonia mangrovi]